MELWYIFVKKQFDYYQTDFAAFYKGSNVVNSLIKS